MNYKPSPTRRWRSVWQDQRRHAEFKASLERLKSGLLKASEMVRQANFLASELQRPVKYSGIKHNILVFNFIWKILLKLNVK